MDTVSTPARVEPFRDLRVAASPEAERAVTVIATYQLSEPGRKASLLAGGDGRALQSVTMAIPASRFHLVTVDHEGVARLKLRPRYERDETQQIQRIDRAPTYQKPPTEHELLAHAARNYQLEQAFFAERTADRASRREANRAVREQVADQFLSDPTQRPARFPEPTPTVCYLLAAPGRMRFDVNLDAGPLGRQVPPEAYRRWRADVRARDERKRQTHAAEAAMHDEKQRALAVWLAASGSPEQQARHAAGMFPMEEAVEAITEEAMQVVRHHPVYAPIGASDLQTHVREASSLHARAVVAQGDLTVEISKVPAASPGQWALVEELQQAFPAALLELRLHRIAWKRDMTVPPMTQYGIRVKLKAGPFVLVREFAAPPA